MRLKSTLQTELKKHLTWLKIMLLFGLQYADEIVSFLKEHLTELQPYFPDNIYRFMGGFIVVASLILGFLATHKDKGQK